MNSRLNYSTLEDAWGIQTPKNETTSIPLEKRYNYKKPNENILSGILGKLHFIFAKRVTLNHEPNL